MKSLTTFALAVATSFATSNSITGTWMSVDNNNFQIIKFTQNGLVTSVTKQNDSLPLSAENTKTLKTNFNINNDTLTINFKNKLYLSDTLKFKINNDTLTLFTKEPLLFIKLW